MMKKLLVLMLVLGLSGVVSAVPCALQLMAPTGPVSPVTPLRVYISTDSTGLDQLAATVIFDDGETHTIDYVIADDVWVENSPTNEPTTLILADGGLISVGRLCGIHLRWKY